MKVVEETMGANYDQVFIIKGQRTKRPRPSSLAGSSSMDEDGHIHGYDGSSSSAAMSTIEFFKNTEEEEDMANCLILLAQGRNKNNEQRQNRRKSVETIHELSGYECKTCNRSFASFQALGGHRASHRKPKKELDQEAHEFNSSDQLVFPSDPRIGNKVVYMNTNNNKSKVHECSICGAEFSSGQALGGHMRRHRNTTPVAAIAMNKDYSTRNVFSLDLNLPAPEEDLDLENNEFLIFSPPALVDCHY